MSSRHRDRGRVRPPALAAAGLALAAAGFAARGLWPGTAHPASAPAVAVPVSAAAVTRTTISARQLVPGTLGYRGAYSVLNELTAGIITWLPAPGQVVRRGQPLFALAGQPVTLLYGQVPAWRAFGPGMTPGPDVRELQRNLAALGFDPAHQMAADGQFGWATLAAVERWQLAHGMAETGTIPLGEVAFLPGPLRVTAAGTPLGSPAAPGAAVLTGTSDTPSVSVSLPVGGPAVRPGDPVLVTMPDETTAVSGTVASVGRVATVPSGTAQGGGAQAAIPLTITVGSVPPGLDQAPVQVAITQQQHRDVLAVPVTALLVLPGGGYAVRAAGAAHQVIPVSLGLFDDATGLVEVTGTRLTAGLSVEVAQG